MARNSQTSESSHSRSPPLIYALWLIGRLWSPALTAGCRVCVCGEGGTWGNGGLSSQTTSRHSGAAGHAEGLKATCLREPPAHMFNTHIHTHRGNDRVQGILMCYFIWQIIEPHPCGLGEEFHSYSCLAFPVETNTPDIPAQWWERESEALTQPLHSPFRLLLQERRSR